MNSPSNGATDAIVARLFTPRFISPWTVAAERSAARRTASITPVSDEGGTLVVGHQALVFVPYQDRYSTVSYRLKLEASLTPPAQSSPETLSPPSPPRKYPEHF